MLATLFGFPPSSCFSRFEVADRVVLLTGFLNWFCIFVIWLPNDVAIDLTWLISLIGYMTVC